MKNSRQQNIYSENIVIATGVGVFNWYEPYKFSIISVENNNLMELKINPINKSHLNGQNQIIHTYFCGVFSMSRN